MITVFLDIGFESVIIKIGLKHFKKLGKRQIYIILSTGHGNKVLYEKGLYGYEKRNAENLQELVKQRV